MEQKQKVRARTLVFSILVYVISLTQHAFTYSDYQGEDSFLSITALFMGALSILGGGLLEWIVWLANPLYLLAIMLFLLSKKAAKAVALIAFFLAFSFVGWNEVLISENGRTATIENLNTGYWFWLLSLIILFIGISSYFTKAAPTEQNSSESQSSSEKAV